VHPLFAAGECTEALTICRGLTINVLKHSLYRMSRTAYTKSSSIGEKHMWDWEDVLPKGNHCFNSLLGLYFALQLCSPSVAEACQQLCVLGCRVLQIASLNLFAFFEPTCRFFWTDVNLWAEELPERSLIVLAGQDELLHAEEVCDTECF